MISIDPVDLIFSLVGYEQSKSLLIYIFSLVLSITSVMPIGKKFMQTFNPFLMTKTLSSFFLQSFHIHM